MNTPLSSQLQWLAVGVFAITAAGPEPLDWRPFAIEVAALVVAALEHYRERSARSGGAR